MKNIKFNYTEQAGVLVYPDAVELFTAIQVIDGVVYARYSGALNLTEGLPPDTSPPDFAVSKRVLYNRLDAVVPDVFETLEADSVDPAKPLPVRKALKRMLRNYNYTTYVQLDSEETQTFLSGLVSLGYISAANKAAVSVRAAPKEVWNGPR